METKSIQEIIPTNLLQEKVLENYKEFAGTPDEELKLACEAILKERQKKFQAKKSSDYWKNLTNPEPLPILTSEEFYKWIIEKRSKQVFGMDEKGNSKFVIDEFNKGVITLLCHYFTHDLRFEETGYKLNKGLIFFGKVGCGKTWIAKLFSDNPKQSYIIKPCRTIAEDFSQFGEESLSKYSTTHKVPMNQSLFGHKEYGYCFDDLGTESIKKNFGNESNTMADILLSRYDRHEVLRFKTHLTTNLSAKDIETRYGARVKSRMREMFNIIQFDNQTPDRRN